MSDDIQRLISVTNGIHGWLTSNEGQLLYRLVGLSPTQNVVEIGSWKGRSTAWLLVSADESGKIVHAVDHFRGSSEHKVMYGEDIDTYTEFMDNMNRVYKEFGIVSDLHVLKMSSEEAATHFEDSTVGLVFIDGSHEYEAVLADLTTWYPKLALSGIVALHDSNYQTVHDAIMSFGCPRCAHMTDSITWWRKGDRI